MTLWSSKEVEKITGGYSTRGWNASGISFDPETLEAGDLFICMPGTDTNNITRALARGAAACVVTIWPAGLEKDHALLIVDNPHDVLHMLARVALKRCGARRIMITGNAARAGTLEMMEAACRSFAYTHSVFIAAGKCDEMALGLARLDAGSDILLLDKESDLPCNFDPEIVLRPVEGFESLEGVEILAVLEAENGTRVRARILEEEIAFTVPQAGQQTYVNALYALQVFKRLGGDLETGARALEFSLEPKINENLGRGVRLLEDASHIACTPARKSFKVLALVDTGRGGRKLALLSSLYDPKAKAGDLRDWALPMKCADVQFLYTGAHAGARESSPSVMGGADSSDALGLGSGSGLKEIMSDVLAPGDVLSFKGARGGNRPIEIEALRSMAHLKDKRESVYTNPHLLSNDR